MTLNLARPPERLTSGKTMGSKSTSLMHRNLPLLLLQARERLMVRFRPILNDNNITEQQWRILRVLLDAKALEPREIGELCRISSPSLVGVLNRMEELGLISRRRFEQDQRRVRVTPTARSRALATRMAPQIEAVYRDIEELIGEDLRDHLYVVLDRLITTLEPYAQDAEQA